MHNAGWESLFLGSFGVQKRKNLARLGTSFALCLFVRRIRFSFCGYNGLEKRAPTCLCEQSRATTRRSVLGVALSRVRLKGELSDRLSRKSRLANSTVAFAKKPLARRDVGMFRTTETPQGGRVTLAGKSVVNLASNNYLGLADAPELIAAAKSALDQYGVGPCASRNIVGDFPVHGQLERALADFKGTEAALVFSSGYAANVGVIPVLVGKGDEIFSDELNHGSLIDGCRLSRAHTTVYRHCDVADLERKLSECEAENKLVMTDAVFSMDGDVAPLDAIADVCERYGATFLVDDAHGDGVMGPMGRGTVAHFGLEGSVQVETGSLGKAFGVMGGFVAGSQELIDRVRVGARSFILTASPLAPSLAAAATEALRMTSADDSRVVRLWENRAYFAERMSAAGFDTGISTTPVVPVMIGDEALAVRMSDALYEEGVYAQAIQYPLVARGRARIRCILSAAHTKEDLDCAVDAFVRVGRELEVL